MGFSPFELVYGRSVHGPLSVLRYIWADEDINEQARTTCQYVLELKEILESSCKQAHDELRKASEAPWLGGRMSDSGAREPGFESSTYDGAVDGDTLWRQQNKILVIILGNKL